MKISDFKVSPFKIISMIGNHSHDLGELDDEYFWDDICLWNQNTYHEYEDIYKSNKSEDKRKVLRMGVEKISYEIQQLMRFGRLPMANSKGEMYNFPDKEVPSFYINDAFEKVRTNTFKKNMETLDD
jgi:hypothetical protein